MDVRRQRRQRSREPLDRRFDQWFKTGRQLVDGVAGTRPGQRGAERAARGSTPRLESVGRWVGDKIDWLLEEDDDWLEPWQTDSQANVQAAQHQQQNQHQNQHQDQQLSQPMRASGKRPLDAISRRATPLIPPAPASLAADVDHQDWPDESTFKVDRWQRQASEPIGLDGAGPDGVGPDGALNGGSIDGGSVNSRRSDSVRSDSVRSDSRRSDSSSQRLGRRPLPRSSRRRH